VSLIHFVLLSFSGAVCTGGFSLFFVVKVDLVEAVRGVLVANFQNMKFNMILWFRTSW
jgi:hypothetical protein